LRPASPTLRWPRTTSGPGRHNVDVHRYPRARFAALVTLLAGLAVAAIATGLRPSALAESAARLGGLGPVLAVFASGVLLAALVPRTVVATAAGLLLGPVAGAASVLAGAAIGATLAFGVGRWLGRDFALTRRPVDRIDGWLAARGFVGVLTVRLLPIAPFGLVSYAFGTTGVRLRPYLIATILSATPSTVLYASLGAAALSPGTPGFWLLVAAAVVLALASWFGGGLLARRHRLREPLTTVSLATAPPATVPLATAPLD
jgi:uncharacterized membrane protein YdjX (TVP38/TMEM64 family)